MSIRLKIGVGFAILIVLLTSLTSFWAATTLGFTLESSDLGKLVALRAQAMDAYRREHDALASVSREVAQAVSTMDFSDAALEEALGVMEKLKRHLELDWIEIYRGGIPLLYPSVRLAGPFPQSHRWPVRLARSGPLSGSSFLVATFGLASPSLTLVVARRPPPLPVDFYYLWDAGGRLDGSMEDLPEADRRELETSGSTQQRFHQGKLLRIRGDRLAEEGPFLLVGYEADMATLTRTGVNALMIRLAVLEVIGLLILGYFLGRRLFEPLDRLKHGIERVAEGHWQQLPLDELPFRDEHDEIGVLARSFNRMVRELAAAQDRLIQVQNQLLQKEKMAVLGRFSASVAHEINNPLGTILISGGLLKEAREAGEAVDLEDIQSIIEEGRRCRRIVESLLRYAQNKPPELEALPLERMVTDTIERLRGSKSLGSLAIEVEIQPVGLVLADPTGLHQVLRNLLENARDAVAGVAEPHIRLSVLAVDPQFARVTVTDNGPGLEAMAEHLFEPLFTTKAKGTGLGLAICQSIVEGHGGRIWAERDEAGRTAFHFTLARVVPPSGS